MTEYLPDRWVVVKVTNNKDLFYKVFACWYGGYAGADHWRTNSGITQAILVDDFWKFSGHSGSMYNCHQKAYGTNHYGNVVLQNFIERAREQGVMIEIMPSDTNWSELNYDAKLQKSQGQ